MWHSKFHKFMILSQNYADSKAEVTQNHQNLTAHTTKQGKTQHRKYKRD
jgi:hypothetical protein